MICSKFELFMSAGVVFVFEMRWIQRSMNILDFVVQLQGGFYGHLLMTTCLAKNVDPSVHDVVVSRDGVLMCFCFSPSLLVVVHNDPIQDDLSCATLMKGVEQQGLWC